MAPKRARSRPQKGDLTPAAVPIASNPPPPVVLPSNSKLCTADGRINVDPDRFPHLHRALDRGLQGHRAIRAQWQEVVDLRRRGQYGAAEVILSELLGTQPPSTTRSASELPLSANVNELIGKLKGADRKAASKIRAELRKLGHKGGLRVAE